MSRSYRTLPDRILARDRIARDRDGSVALPRIVARRAPPGDFHPLGPRTLRRYLRWVPWEYVYGLRCVELMPRRGKAIGDPYGSYRPRERKIRLYSVPKTTWTFERMGEPWKAYFRSQGAQVTDSAGAVVVEWADPTGIRVFYAYDVLFHELGHHHVHRYGTKRKMPITVRTHEFLADQRSDRLGEKLMREIERRRRAAPSI